ncbi:MAG: hypothetical protein NTY71_04090 [Methanoregula sp.]|nr:hypothetical protein [Methanoregula sp.]
MTTVAKMYKAICKTYFPLWSPWEYRYNPSWGNSGYCNYRQKLIFFGSINPTLVIHEICHAVTKESHGKRWQARMKKASIMAKKQENPDLSTEIINDISLCLKDNEKMGLVIAKRMMYDQIENAINELYLQIDEIGITHIVDHILSENGIKKEWDMPLYNKTFRRGMVVAEKALKERMRDEQIKQRFTPVTNPLPTRRKT